MFWIWAERSISMRSLVAIRAKPSKQWPAAPELAKDPGRKLRRSRRSAQKVVSRLWQARSGVAAAEQPDAYPTFTEVVPWRIRARTSVAIRHALASRRWAEVLTIRYESDQQGGDVIENLNNGETNFPGSSSPVSTFSTSRPLMIHLRRIVSASGPPRTMVWRSTSVIRR